MTLPRLEPDSIVLQAELLTPERFAPYGTAIISPFASDLTHFPDEIPQSQHASYQPKAVPANQATALKTSPVSPLTNNYASAGSHHSRNNSAGLMSIFSSFPRKNTYISYDRAHSKESLRLKLGILERHPYTTQTFCPFNYSRSSGQPGQNPTAVPRQSYMLIIVAPSLLQSQGELSRPPDLSNIRAFYAPLAGPQASNMAVTYAPGTWHAPMIVLGQRRVDFLVTQFASGVADDDCQEVLIGDGPDKAQLTSAQLQERRQYGLTSPNVEVDLTFTQDLSNKNHLSKL